MMDQFKQRKVSPKKIRACKEVKYHEKLSFTTDIWKFVTTKADFETNIGKNRLIKVQHPFILYVYTNNI